MTYPAHALIAMSGTLAGVSTSPGDEIFQIGIRVTAVGGGFLDDPQGFADDVGPAIASFWGGAASKISPYAVLDRVKVNNILPDGKYQDPVTHEHDFNPGIIGGDSFPELPFCCIVWSWETALKRGPGSKGRVYPPNSYSTTGSSAISGTQQDDHALAARGLLTAIATGGSTHTCTPCVVSNKGAGVASPITGIRVGRIVDVQRRRKNALTENYVSTPFPA